MSIIYALVARGTVILAEHTNSSGNFTTVTEAILEKIPPNNSKLTYVYDRYLFHYICEDGLTYMCMADDTFGRRIPFAFLQDIKEKFLTQYNQDQAIHAQVPYAMNEFSKTIAKQMTDNLNHQAFAFKKRSTALKRAMWWKNMKLMFVLTAVIVFLIYLIICAACGFPFWSSCRS
ncbi:Vesicle-associated membrane protein [Entomortierella beljakovae]|nr:Vesicle-associated membrane protein [Entomortierella beljakovae]